MAFYQNSNADVDQFSISGNIRPCIKVMKARLQQIEEKKEILEGKVAKCKFAKAEVMDLRNQLEDLQYTIKEMTENQQQCYDNVSRDLDEVSSKYQRMTSMIDQLKRENHEFQCTIQSKKSKELKNIDKINKLKIIETKSTGCVYSLCNKINVEMGHAKALQQQQIDLEKAIACKTIETQKTSRNMDATEKGVQSKNEELLELRRQKAENGRTLEELMAVSRKHVEELDRFRNEGAERLAMVDRSFDAVANELAAVRFSVIEWKAKREHAEKGYRRLRAANDEDACRVQTTLKGLEDERDGLIERLTDVAGRLTTAENENRLSDTAVRGQADRLANLMDEVDRLEQRLCHERLLLHVKQSRRRTENTLFESDITSKNRELSLVQTEVEELRKKTSYCNRVLHEQL